MEDKVRFIGHESWEGSGRQLRVSEDLPSQRLAGTHLRVDEELSSAKLSRKILEK